MDIRTSNELIQMEINKNMTNGIFTMNGEHTQSETLINITDSRQSCKSFGIIDESECFSYNSLIFSQI